MPGGDLTVAGDDSAVQREVDLEEGAQGGQRAREVVDALVLCYGVLEPEIARILLLLQLLQAHHFSSEGEEEESHPLIAHQ